LPHQLVAAFHATLEEVASADLLIHVIDASAPDRQRRADAVRDVLADVGAARVPTVEVFNKIDRLEGTELENLKRLQPGALWISALDGTGKDRVLAEVAARLAMDAERVRLEFDDSEERDRKLVAELYRHARVVSHVTRADRVSIEADVPRRMLPRFTRAKVPA
jgi:GTP-binding protein HflX